MTAEEFVAWYEEQPARTRCELLDGEVVEAQPDPPRVAAIKARLAARIRQQIVSRVLPCLPVIDGMPVKIDDDNVFEPDIFVRYARLGMEAPSDATIIEDPAIVMELVSPETRPISIETKLAKYFDNPHIKHLLVVEPLANAITHHERSHQGEISARRYESGLLDMPLARIDLDLDELFRG